MLKTAFLIFVTIAIAVAGGAGSVWYALSAQEGIGAISVGGWTTYPDIGTPSADPYSRARFVRAGGLSLGDAEGVVFYADTDRSGARLRRDCTYTVVGTMPPARHWTLYAADRDHDVLPDVGRRQPATHSLRLLRNTDGSFAISVASRPMPGNWIGISGAGPMVFVLSMYDTPVASKAQLAQLDLPQVLRTGCNA